jgi:hypothetical protein
VQGTPAKASGGRPGVTVPSTISIPSALTRMPVSAGRPMVRANLAIASSSRSSDSTSSDRPPPSRASRSRNPALTARSMPTQ